MHLWSERIVVALPQAHPLSANAPIHWSEINNECFLINRREPGPEFQEAVRMKFVEWDPKHVAEQDLGVDRILSLVGAGFGLALVLEGATGASYPGVVFREIEDDSGSVRMDFTACWRRTNSNPALAHFLDLLRERYPDLQAKNKATG
ncbi:MAG: hypothetical protein F8N37_15960 [Telmatospirillum sp.]|nr:hypothetical protein [Telmatospirillum sp.]